MLKSVNTCWEYGILHLIMDCWTLSMDSWFKMHRYMDCNDQNRVVGRMKLKMNNKISLNSHRRGGEKGEEKMEEKKSAT